MIVARFQLKPANKSPAYIGALSVLQLSRSNCVGLCFFDRVFGCETVSKQYHRGGESLAGKMCAIFRPHDVQKGIRRVGVYERRLMRFLEHHHIKTISRKWGVYEKGR
jgi:hypothetical protein